MNRDEAIRRAEIAMAWAKGEPVQCQQPDGSWWTMDPPEYATPDYQWGGPAIFDTAHNYRIKPKPLEYWVWKPDDGSPVHHVVLYDTPVTDSAYAAKYPGRWVRMREIDE